MYTTAWHMVRIQQVLTQLAVIVGTDCLSTVCGYIFEHLFIYSIIWSSQFPVKWAWQIMVPGKKWEKENSEGQNILQFGDSLEAET